MSIFCMRLNDMILSYQHALICYIACFVQRVTHVPKLPTQSSLIIIFLSVVRYGITDMDLPHIIAA